MPVAAPDVGFKPEGMGADLGFTPEGAAPPVSATPSPAVAPTPQPDWGTLYGGLDGLNSRLTPEQNSAFGFLDAKTDNPKETRAKAINRTYLQDKLKMPAGVMDNNWGAVKDAYAKRELGMDAKDITDTALYGAISKRFKEIQFTREHSWLSASPHEQVEIMIARFPSILGKDEAGNPSVKGRGLSEPFVPLPSAPSDLPNIPSLGMSNPALSGAFYNSVFKPLVEGVESPLGIVTLGVGSKLKMAAEAGSAGAKAGLKVMQWIFSLVMGKAAVEATPQMVQTLKDPDVGLQQKAESIGHVVTPTVMALTGALSELGKSAPKALKELADRPASEVPAALSEASAKAKTVEEKAAIHATMDEVHKAMESSETPPSPAPDKGGEVTKLAPIEERIRRAKETAQKVLEARRELEMVKELNGSPEQIKTAEDKVFQAELEDEKYGMLGAEGPNASAEVKTESPLPDQIAAVAKAERPGSLVGIKNEVVDAEMAKMGLDPAEHGAGLTWEQAKADADAKLAADPFAGQKLVKDLAGKPRPITGQEDALLLTEVNRLKLERDAAEEDLLKAKQAGDRDGEAEANVRIAAARDAFTEAESTATKVGTPQAQGLALRRMMMREDYSIASMERQLAAATETGKLTPEQVEQIRGLSKHIRETAEAVEKKAKKALSPEAKQKMLKGRLRAQIVAMDKQIQKGEKASAKRGGVQPDDEAFRLKELRDALKSAYDVMFPKEQAEPLTAEQQITRALAAKDRQIDALQGQIDNQAPFAPGKKPASTDPRMIAKQAKIDALKEEREYLRDTLQTPKDPPTDIEVRLKELDRQIAAIEKQLKDEAPFSKGKKVQPTSPEIEAKQSTLESLKEQREYMRERLQPSPDPKTKAEKSLAAYKSRTAKSTKELLDRVAKNDLAPKPKPEPVTLDLEGELLKAAHERAKQAFDRAVLEERIKNRSFFEKSQNTLVKWRRGFLLSSPVTLAKLTSAAAWRMGTTLAEEGVGSVLSKVPGVRDVAEKAPRYGAANSDAEAAAITQAFTQGMRDAYDLLRTGKSNLDVIYGKGADPAIREYDLVGRSAIDFFGSIHGALKSPVKRAEFARSFQKRTSFAIRNGVDASNPMVQTRIALEAYKDANRAIFLQDNMLTDFFKRGLSAFEQTDKQGRIKYPAGKMAATAFRVALPIVKVPTNIAAESFEYATGSLTGSWRLAKALRGGMENLSPEHADLIMRNLQKGSLGAAALLMGYFSADDVGGYYQPGEKRKPGDVKAGNVRLFGQEVPSYLLHTPIMEVVQLGATVRRVAESKMKKRDADPQGLGSGVWAASLGLIEGIPYARTAAEYTKLFDPRERQYETGQIAKDIVDPQLLQWIARVTDMRDGARVNRKPGTVGEAIKSGIPGARQTVPETKRDPWTTYRKKQ